MREHPLLLGRTGLGFFLQLNAKLGLLGFAHAVLLRLTARTLFRQTGFLFGLQSCFVFGTPSPRFGFRTLSRVFGPRQLRFLFSRDACRLNGVQLQELVRQ
jgi:hypothetical protein